jgi:7-cyano-7-deazaguanine synthase in queuosine biosynthesis
MAKDLAIILNNGSVNSAVATALAAQKFRAVMLHVESMPTEGAGPQQASRARAAYDLQVAHFKPYREHTLAMPFLSMLESPASPHAQAPAAADPRHASVAPQMTALLPMLAAAGRFAAHYQAAAIYLGLRIGPLAEDLAQATEFVQVWNELLNLPCGMPELNIEAPLLELEPWQVVDIGFNAGAPFERTWSCQENGPEPCGACPGCRARDAAFQQAGKPDPLRGARK